MKIVEALKKVKYNREKIDDLSNLIQRNYAHMESENGKTPYNDPKAKIKEWLQSVRDIQSDNQKLLSAIQKTNLQTEVTIEIGGNQVTKTISEWIVRRREGVDQERQCYTGMITRLQQKTIELQGELKVDNVVRNFPSEKKDQILMTLNEEKSLIDSALEVVNATTDLVD